MVNKGRQVKVLWFFFLFLQFVCNSLEQWKAFSSSFIIGRYYQYILSWENYKFWISIYLTTTPPLSLCWTCICAQAHFYCIHLANTLKKWKNYIKRLSTLMLLTSVQNKQTTFGSKNYLQSELILVNIEGFYISFPFRNIY